MTLSMALVIVVFLKMTSASFDYCTLGADNTLCQYKPTSEGSACVNLQYKGVSEDDIKTILDTHNTLRKKVAQGLEDRGAPGPQPSASNMRKLVWDEDLAMMAQTHAQQCVFGHDTNRNTENFTYVGQNVAMESSTAPYKRSDWATQIIRWYSEVERFQNSSVTSFSMTSSKPIGHYTQVVWANTYKIGCGMARYITSGRFGNNQFYVCNYGPGGNFLNQPVYQIGSPVTACPDGTVAEDGLCAEDIKADIEIMTL